MNSIVKKKFLIIFNWIKWYMSSINEFLEILKRPFKYVFYIRAFSLLSITASSNCLGDSVTVTSQICITIEKIILTLRSHECKYLPGNTTLYLISFQSVDILPYFP